MWSFVRSQILSVLSFISQWNRKLFLIFLILHIKNISGIFTKHKHFFFGELSHGCLIWVPSRVSDTLWCHRHLSPRTVFSLLLCLFAIVWRGECNLHAFWDKPSSGCAEDLEHFCPGRLFIAVASLISTTRLYWWGNGSSQSYAAQGHTASEGQSLISIPDLTDARVHSFLLHPAAAPMSSS